MIRQTIIATQNSYTILFPSEWIGQKVTVVYDKETTENDIDQPTATQFVKASDIYKDCQVDLSNFKFSREEANEYE